MNCVNRIFVTGLVLGLGVLGFAQNGLADVEERLNALEEKVGLMESSVTYDAGVFSKYIWRGWNLFNDPVMQGNIGVKQGGVYAGVWGNYAMGDLDRLSELDFTLDFSHSFGIVGAKIGYIKYTFPNVPAGVGRESSEIYTGLSMAVPFSPSITAYYDSQAGDGTYIETAISHTMPLKGVDVTPSLALGYNDHQWRAEGSSFSNLLPGVSLAYNLKGVTIKGIYAYSIGLDSDYGFDRDYGYGGLNFSAGF